MELSIRFIFFVLGLNISFEHQYNQKQERSIYMPLLLDDLKYNKLYNKQIFLPTNEDNRRKLASIVLLTPSYESSVRCMTYPRFIDNRLYTSYYTEKDINFVINRESSSMTLERNVLQELDLIDNSLSKYNRVTIPIEDIGMRFPELTTPEGLMGTAYIFTDSSDRAYGYAVVNRNALVYLWSASSKIRMDLLDFVIDTVGVTAIAAHLDHDLLVKAKKDYHFVPARGKYLVRNVFKELNEGASKYTKIPMNSKSVSKYKSSAKYLSHFRTEKDGSYDGYIWLDNDKVVAACSVDTDRGMIQAIEISKEYQGQGLSYDILKTCVSLGGKSLTVAKNNTVAKHVYDKYGFKVSDTTDNQYKMVLEQSTVLTESASLIDAEIKIWQAQIKITEEIIKFFNNASWVKAKLGSMKSKLIKLPIDGYNNSLMTMDDFKNQLENQKVTLDFYTNMKALDLKEQYDLSDIVKEYTYWIKALKCPKTLKVKILKRTISSYKLTIKEYERALKDYEKMTVMNRRKENLKALASKTFSIFGFLTGGQLGPLKSMAMKAILPKSNKKSILSDDELKAKIALYTKIVEALEEELSETQALNESTILLETEYRNDQLYLASSSDKYDGRLLSDIDPDKFLSIGITTAIGFNTDNTKQESYYVYQPKESGNVSEYETVGRRIKIINDLTLRLVGQIKVSYDNYKGKPDGYDWIWHYDENGNKVSNWQESAILTEREGSYNPTIPEDIIDLNRRLNSFQYGISDAKGIKLDGTKRNYATYTTRSLIQFLNNRIGICYDYVNYEAKWFKEHGYRFSTYYIRINDGDWNPDHAFLIFYLPETDLYYYFESSWKDGDLGIHQFNSEEDAVRHVLNQMITKEHNTNYEIYKYNWSEKLFGIPLNQFYRWILNSKRITSIKESNILLEDGRKTHKENLVEEVLNESAPVIPLNEDFVINETSIRSNEYMTLFESSFTEDAKYNNMIRKMIYPERIRNQKELLYQYDRIKEDCPFIKRTFLNYERYNGYNLFIDMSYYMTNFIKHNYLKLDRGVNITIDFINRFLEDDRLDSLGYKKKTVFVPIHDWTIKENTSLWDYKSNINPISIIYRMIKKGHDFQILRDTWGKTDFVFLGDTGYFKLNLAKFGSKDLPRFMANIKTLISHERVVDNDEPDHSTKGLVASIADKIEMNSHNKIEINNLVGSAAGDTMTPEEIQDKVSKMSSDVADKVETKEDKRSKKEKEVVDGIKAIASKSTDEDTIETDLDNNEYLKQAIVDLQSMSPDAVDITPTRAARITELNNKFMENQIKGKKIVDLIGDLQNDPLPEIALPVDSINDEWKHITYTSFNNIYNVDADISKCIYHFGQCTVPVAVRDIKVEDNSTSEDSIETWTVQCEDAYGKRFTLKFDEPKIVDKRFMKLRGNKKTMSGQLMNLPIIKTDRDTCQITSNYNKIFVRRFNTSSGKSNAVAGRFIKTILKLKESGSKDYDIKLGDMTLISNKYNLPLDYIDIGSKIAKIIVKKTAKMRITMYFDQDEFLAKYKDKLDPKQGDFAFVVAEYDGGKEDIIYPDSTYSTIAEFATAMLWDSNMEFPKVYETTTQSIKSTYSKASIMSTEIPVGVLLGYAIGLTAMLKRAAIEYTVEDKRPSYNKNSYDSIRLADCWIVYKNTYLASMILNGLKECDMAAYTLAETNTKRMWLEQLDSYGGRIKADGLDMFYDLMFDPITKEVCAKYRIPDNYCDALIYASHLLSDIKFNEHSDITGNRFRNNEIIAGYTYKILANSYSVYRRELKAGRQAMMSVKRSAIIDSILMDNTCSDLSILSPLLEIESANSVSFKGLSGMNTDRAYGLDKRIYSDSMKNVLAMSTGFSSNVGINRQATIDMNIDTPRGYIKSSSVDDMSVTKSFCMTEALTPYGSVSDDTFRTAMTFIQTSKHEMRTEISDPLLVSNGSDQAIAYMTSDTFSFKTKESGIVKEKTDEYMVLEYKSGKTEVVDLREQMMKNSDGGMWIPVQLVTKCKEGSHFKSGEIIAVDPLSYSNDIGPSDNYSYNIGTLVKFAILATDAGYEDACVHTEWLSNALSSKVVDRKQYIFPKSTNVYEIVKKGQSIQEGDPLIIFQNAFEEEDANNLIRMLTNADENAISELGRIPIRSKVTGVIDDIKIYRCVEVEELSPSLKKIVTDYEKETQKYNKVLEKYDPEKAKVADATYKLEPTGKLKNCEGSIMIEFYISYIDNFSAADKVVNYSALKGVSSKQIPAGKEPRSKFRPDEKVHYQQSDIGDMKRMVGSIIKIGALNKVLIETGRQACDIMGIKWKYLDEY